MSQPRVIQADFANWRPVTGRKVLQLIFELDISHTKEVLTMLGTPTPGESKWCAIALLNTERAPVAGNSKPDLRAPGDSPAAPSGGVQAKKSWADYKRSQQAAILCADPDFQKYFGGSTELVVLSRLKVHLHIVSRKELDDPENHARWDEFVALYHMHRDRLK